MVYDDPFSRRFAPAPRGIPARRTPELSRADAMASPRINAAALQRSASRTLGLPSGSDVASGRADDIHHLIGTTDAGGSPAAIEAAVAAYRKERGGSFYSFREYLHACANVETLRNRHLRQERDRESYAAARYLDRWRPSPQELVSAEDMAFLALFSRDTHTPDHTGYLAYLARREPDLAALLAHELPVYLPEQSRWRHTYIVGATGYGKSELLKALVYSYVTQPQSAAVVVIDPAGEFVEQIAHWPEFVGSDRLVYVHPTFAHGLSPRINPFEISGVSPDDTSEAAIGIKQVVAQQLLAAFQEVIAGGMGSALSLPMRALLMPCILALLDRPGSTFLDLQRFMNDEENADLIAFGATRTHYRAVASYFQSGFLQPRLSGTKGSIYTKLQELFSTGFFVDLTCGPSTIDLRRAVEARKVILFNLSKGKIGDAESQAFGRLIVALLQGIAKRRAELPEARRVPTHLIIDECHNFITESVREILLEARKYRLFLTLSQQIVGEGMSTGMRDVITGSANIQMSGYAQPLHQAEAARLVSLPPEEIARLDRGEFFVRLSRHPAFRLRIRSDLLGFKHRMTTPSWNRLRARTLRAYYRPKVEETHTSPGDPGEPVSPSRYEPDHI